MRTCPKCKENFDDDVEFCPKDGMKLRRASRKGDALVGTVLDGRYLVEKKIGEGGMGSVYKGHQQNIDRPVAIKTLRKTLIDSDEFIDRFFREAQIASKINHPNCVTIYDYGHAENDVLYIAMEFLDGEPLSDRADRGHLTLKETLEIACDTSRALAAAHTFNVVHRDLKPDNIFVVDVPGGGKNAKVLDFGIAKALDAEKSMTRTGMIFGTPEYMSPEQCAGTDIDGRSDLYSLGCILYELVGGRTPFRATTPMAVLMAHVNEEAPGLDQTVQIPTNLNSIIFKLLEKDPDKRFQSANELLEALEHELGVLQGVTSGTNPMLPTSTKDTSAVAFDSTVAFRPDPGSSDTLQSPATKNTKLALVAIVLVLLAGVGVAAAVALMSGDPSGDDAAAVAGSDDGLEVLEPPIDRERDDTVPTPEPPPQVDEVAANVAAEDSQESESVPVDDGSEVGAAAGTKAGDSRTPEPDEVAPPVEEKKTDPPKKTPRKRAPKKTETEASNSDKKESAPEEKKTKPDPPKKVGTDKEYESAMDDMFEM